MAVEVEIRSFITKKKHGELLTRLKKEARFVGTDHQETFYFEAPIDLRIQRNDSFSKIWAKGGRMHDTFRNEVEIRFNRSDFKSLESILVGAGLRISSKWYRTRHTFRQGRTSIMLDHTRAYGYIIELERMATESDKEAALEVLKEKARDLGVKLSHRSEFERRFALYKKRWKAAAAGRG